jgi:hypothetical protein
VIIKQWPLSHVWGVCLKGLEISVQEGLHIRIKEEVYINLCPEMRVFSAILKYYFQQQIPKLCV